MITDMLREEAKITAEHGGPFRNVRRALDGTSAANPRLQKILAEELTAFTAALVGKQQRRDRAGMDNFQQHRDALQKEADVKAQNAFNTWCAHSNRARSLSA